MNFISQIWQTFKCSGTVFENLALYRRTKDLVPLFDPKVHLKKFSKVYGPAARYANIENFSGMQQKSYFHFLAFENISHFYVDEYKILVEGRGPPKGKLFVFVTSFTPRWLRTPGTATTPPRRRQTRKSSNHLNHKIVRDTLSPTPPTVGDRIIPYIKYVLSFLISILTWIKIGDHPLPPPLSEYFCEECKLFFTIWKS